MIRCSILLLALDAARVAARVVPEAAYEMAWSPLMWYSAGLEMDVQVAPAVVVVHRLGDGDVDAADRVDQILGSVDAQHHVTVEYVPARSAATRATNR